MLAGELYDSNDPELVSARDAAVRLYRRFNSSEDPEEQLRLLGELLGSLGAGCTIMPPFFVDYGKNIYLGSKVYMNVGCVILDSAKVTIGDETMLGPTVQLYAATHPIDAELRTSGLELTKPINIGRRVWIGGGSVVCPSVTIGDDTTIGAGSVVTKDIPAGVVAVGNPARVIRRLYESI